MIYLRTNYQETILEVFNLKLTSLSNFYSVLGLAYIIGSAIRGTYWSLLGSAGIDAVMMGSAIGLISLVGYLPDIILPQLNSYLWNTYGDTGGYTAHFLVSAMLGVIGAILALVFNWLHSAETAQSAAAAQVVAE